LRPCCPSPGSTAWGRMTFEPGKPSLQQESHWDSDRQRRIQGEMRLSRQVRLNADAETDMGAFLAEILASGTAQLQRIEPRLRDSRSIQAELLAEAIADARKRATGIAEGDSRRLGRLIRAEEAGRGRINVTGSRQLDQSAQAIRFEPEAISLDASVQAVFALE